ncbi:APSE-2 prophage hypothetical [Candidatus Magnetoovum chiemensis]|nr:APSE-2 prophage hypothetical [Candidatus Magnetoovum chiemensis]
MTMPKVLREKLGEDGADAFASVIKNLETDWRKDLVTKETLMKETTSIRDALTKETTSIRDALTKETTSIRETFTKEINSLRLEIERVKSEQTLMKWMLGIVLAGVISLVMKTFFP